MPEPDIGSAPPLHKTVVVQFPVWLWIDEDQWGPRTAEVSVSGGSASVTATPREVVGHGGREHRHVRRSGDGARLGGGVGAHWLASFDLGSDLPRGLGPDLGRARVSLCGVIWGPLKRVPRTR